MEAKSPNKNHLSLADYQEINKGYKKPLTVQNSFYEFGKGCLAIGLPLLAVGGINAQCQSFNLNNIFVDQGMDFLLDVDGDGNDDLRFFEQQNGTLKVSGLGSFSVVRTNGPYTTFSAFRFGSGASIPGGLPAATVAYMDYGGVGNSGGTWNPPSSGFLGVKKGADYGFVQMTVARDGGGTSGRYILTFPDGGAPQAGAGNATAGDCNSLLPVELTSFFTRVDGQSVKLLWQTASEEGNAGFEIQRSENGRDFERIYWVDGYGSSDRLQQYEFTDEDLKAGASYYYRLRQVDFDGQSELSPVVRVDIDRTGTQISDFFPNPSVAGASQVAITTANAGEWEATVYDARGLVIANQYYQLPSGETRIQLPTDELSPGAYFVKFTSAQERFYKTLIIK